jgi:hypothetical protein
MRRDLPLAIVPNECRWARASLHFPAKILRWAVESQYRMEHEFIPTFQSLSSVLATRRDNSTKLVHSRRR